MNEAQRDVALFRYSMIREAADESLTIRQRGRLVRKLAGRDHVGPNGRRVRVARGTIDRWIRAYRAGGFEALAPVTRTGEPVTEQPRWRTDRESRVRRRPVGSGQPAELGGVARSQDVESRRRVGHRRLVGTRERSGIDVLAWHEAATRRCNAARSRAADRGRADEWTRPGGHRRGPNAAHESG